MRVTLSADSSLAGLAVVILLLDPGVGLGQAITERRAWLPTQDLLNHRIVTISAGDPLRRVEQMLALQVHATDFLGKIGQCVDGEQFARAQVDRRGDQIFAMGDLIDTLGAVVNVPEAARLLAISAGFEGEWLSYGAIW